MIAMKAVFKDLNLKIDADQKKKGSSNKGLKNKDKTRSQGKKIPKWKLENSKNVKKLKKEGKPYHWFKWHNDNKGQ